MPERQILDAVERIYKRRNTIVVLNQLVKEQRSSNESDSSYMFDAIKGVLINEAPVGSALHDFLYQESCYNEEKDARAITEVIKSLGQTSVKNIVYVALALQFALIDRISQFVISNDPEVGAAKYLKIISSFDRVLLRLGLEGVPNEEPQGYVLNVRPIRT